MRKIAIIGKPLPDTMTKHIYVTLKHMDYEVEYFDLEDNLLSRILGKRILSLLNKVNDKYSKKFYDKKVDKIVEFKPDLIMTVIRHLPPWLIQSLKEKIDTKIILWSGDSIANFGRGYIFVSNYDAIFVKDYYLFTTMKSKLSLNVYYLPEAFNPLQYETNSNEEVIKKYDVSLIGNFYPYRSKIVEQLISSGINIELFGDLPRWMDRKWENIHTNRQVYEKEKALVISQSKINLNIMHYTEINNVNVRLFELSGLGGFQICDRKDVIKDLFIEDKEIVCFDTVEELKEKIFYYLDHQDEAVEIAEKALRRVYAEHTYEHRIKEIFHIIGFEENMA